MGETNARGRDCFIGSVIRQPLRNVHCLSLVSPSSVSSPDAVAAACRRNLQSASTTAALLRRRRDDVEPEEREKDSREHPQQKIHFSFRSTGFSLSSSPASISSLSPSLPGHCAQVIVRITTLLVGSQDPAPWPVSRAEERLSNGSCCCWEADVVPVV